MMFVSLNALEPTVIDTRKEGHHTDYAVRIQPKQGGLSDSTIVYRRFSAFVQLQRLAERHFQDVNYCCGGECNCLLTNFVKPVFESTEFSTTTTRLTGLLARNSKSVVAERVVFLNAFLTALQDALDKCPPIIVQRCEQENCKLTKLLKSFFGCLEQPRLTRARSV
jgi:hypothetical protein